MGFYNMVFGVNPYSKIILAAISLDIEEVPRFRDCFVTEGKIAVYTRMGAGNAECWADWTDHGEDEDGNCLCPACAGVKRLEHNSNYLYAREDDFDRTYKTFYFDIPDHLAAMNALAALDIGEFDPAQMWHDAIKALER